MGENPYESPLDAEFNSNAPSGKASAKRPLIVSILCVLQSLIVIGGLWLLIPLCLRVIEIRQASATLGCRR